MKVGTSFVVGAPRGGLWGWFSRLPLARLAFGLFDDWQVRRLWVGREIRVCGVTRTVTAVDRETSTITIDSFCDLGSEDEFTVYPS